MEAKLSEIRARCSTTDDYGDSIYLLDLVERLEKELGNQQCPACEIYFSDSVKESVVHYESNERREPCSGCKEARALLKELEL